MIGTVVYISNHKSYVDKAINSCISLKKTNPNVKTLLITKHGTTILNNVFDEVKYVEQKLHGSGRGLDGFYYKVQCMQHVFDLHDKSIYMDCDTYITDDITELLDCLKHFDIACMTAPFDKERPVINGDILTACVPYNTGVMALRKSNVTINTLKTWLDLYTIKYKNKTPGTDQPDFNSAVLKNNPRMCELSNTYNARLCFPATLSSKVKIIHCHTASEKMADEVNSHPNAIRQWAPNRGIIYGNGK